MHRTISAEDLPKWTDNDDDTTNLHEAVSTSIAVQSHFRNVTPVATQKRKCVDNCRACAASVASFVADIDRQKLKRQIKNRFPIFSWMRTYNRKKLKDDVGCGLTLGIMMIPQGMAYALLVGVPPQYGIYTSIFPTLIYAMLGTSHHLSVGPAALVCLLTAEAASNVVPLEEKENYILATSFVAFIVGLTQLVLAVFQMGEVIAAFLADPVISGFTNGASILIFMSQVKYFLGAEIPRSDFVTTVGDLGAALPHADVASLLIGILSVVILWAFKKLNVKYRKDRMPIPGELVLCAMATFFVWVAHLEDLDVVGDIPTGLQAPSTDFFDKSLFFELASAGGVLGVVIYVMTISVGRSLGHKHDYRIQAKQEIITLSMAHMITPLFGCFPCSASLSRSALAGALGPSTPLHNVFSSLLLIFVIYLITPVIATLPNATLGAIVVFAIRNMLNFKEPRDLYRLNVHDFGLWLCAFTGTLFGGVIVGIGISVSVSVLWLLQKNIRPKMAVLGVLPGTTIYRNIERFEDAREVENVKIFRFGASLNFANKDYFEMNLERLLLGKLLANADPKKQLVFANKGDSTSSSPMPGGKDNDDGNTASSMPPPLALNGASSSSSSSSSSSAAVAAAAVASNHQQLQNGSGMHPSSSVPSLPDIMEEGQALEQEDRAAHKLKHGIPSSPSSRGSGQARRRSSVSAAAAITAVIIEASSINDIDASAVRMLTDLAKKFKQRNLRLCFANVKGAVRDLLYKSDFYEHVPVKNMYLSLHDAVISTTRMEMKEGKQVLRRDVNRFHRYVPGAMSSNRKTKLQVARTTEHLPDGSIREWRVVSRVVQNTGDVTPERRNSNGRGNGLEALDRSIMFDEDSKLSNSRSGGVDTRGSVGLLQSLSHVAHNVPYNVRKRANSQHHDAEDQGSDDELLVSQTSDITVHFQPEDGDTTTTATATQDTPNNNNEDV